MEQKLFLEITYGDNDWAEVMNNILPAIRSTLQSFRTLICWNELELEDLASYFRTLIATQLNLQAYLWHGKDSWDYTEEVSHIKFKLVEYDNLKASDNYETAYIQLYGNDQQYGEWFIV